MNSKAQENIDNLEFSIRRQYTYIGEETTKQGKLSFDVDNNLLRKVKYTYDKNNNKIKTEKQLANNTFLAKYDYTFDSNNRKVESLKQDFKKDQLVRKVYEYNEDGKQIKSTQYTDNKLSKTTEYKYNSHGDPIELAMYDASGNLTSRSITEYTYDSKNRKIEKRSYSAEKKLKKTIRYTYNHESVKTHTYTYYYSGRRKNNVRIYAFDTLGRKTGSTIYFLNEKTTEI